MRRNYRLLIGLVFIVAGLVLMAGQGLADTNAPTAAELVAEAGNVGPGIKALIMANGTEIPVDDLIAVTPATDGMGATIGVAPQRGFFAKVGTAIKEHPYKTAGTVLGAAGTGYAVKRLLFDRGGGGGDPQPAAATTPARPARPDTLVDNSMVVSINADNGASVAVYLNSPPDSSHDNH